MKLLVGLRGAKQSLFFLKIDIEKAFDSLSYFLDSILEQMNFGPKWRNWVVGCLSSASISVLINGSPSKEFPMTRGVRQGDPMAPFLFIIAMEGLNIALIEAKRGGFFQGINLPHNGPSISHFLFADDALFVGNWSKKT